MAQPIEVTTDDVRSGSNAVVVFQLNHILDLEAKLAAAYRRITELEEEQPLLEIPVEVSDNGSGPDLPVPDSSSPGDPEASSKAAPA
jgi:hypothetical protein